MRILAAALTAAALAFTAPAAHAADWVRAESPNFILYSDVSTPSAKRYLETLEVFDAVLRARHGMKADKPARRKLPIYLLRRDEDLKRISPGIRSTVAGYYSSHLEDTYAVATESRKDNSVILHEYVHHFMLAYFPYNYPAWLTEGYAEYFMTFKLTDTNFELGNVNQNRAAWLSNTDFIPYELVLKSRPMDLRSDAQVAMYYAQSWALTHYMLSDPGRSRQLDAYIAAVGAGADPVKAFTDATGHTPQTIGRLVRAYLVKGFPYTRFERAKFAAPAVTVAALPAGTGDLLLMSQRIKADNGEDAPSDRTDGPVLLAAARKVAAPYAGARMADLTLARAELKLGDAAVAERLLAALREKDPNDVDVLIVSAAHRLKAAEAATGKDRAALLGEARAMAGKAYKLDSNHYQTLVAYARGRESTSGYPNDNDLDVLRDALELAPQVSSLRLKTAQALVGRNKYAEAARVLRPLALNPHGGEVVGAARALLTLIEAKSATEPAS